jgi:transcriptional regulator
MGLLKRRQERPDLLPGTLDLLILKSLTTGVLHGYGIAEYIQRTSRDVLQIEEGSLYPALQRLLVQGLVAAEWGQSANNRRARYYRLTPAGRRRLGEAQASFDQIVDAIRRVLNPGDPSAA